MSFSFFCQVYDTPTLAAKGLNNRDLAHSQEIYDVPPSVEKGLQVVSDRHGISIGLGGKYFNREPEKSGVSLTDCDQGTCKGHSA